MDFDCLARNGQARGTRYRLPGQPRGGQLSVSSEPTPGSSEQYDLDSEQYGRLMSIAAAVREKGRANKVLVKETILQLCTEQYLSLRTLAELLGREPDSIRNHYITPMLREGVLQARFPEHPNHPQQAYIASAS